MQTVRTKDGLMVMKISPRFVDHILKDMKGKVTIKKYKDKTEAQVFEIEEDYSINASPDMKIFLRSGYFIEL